MNKGFSPGTGGDYPSPPEPGAPPNNPPNNPSDLGNG